MINRPRAAATGVVMIATAIVFWPPEPSKTAPAQPVASQEAARAKSPKRPELQVAPTQPSAASQAELKRKDSSEPVSVEQKASDPAPAKK